MTVALALFYSGDFSPSGLSKKDVQGLKIKEAKCECEDTHEYYQAAWLMPVRKDGWIRIEGGGRATVRPQTLASLLRDNGWKPSFSERKILLLSIYLKQLV